MAQPQSHTQPAPFGFLEHHSPCWELGGNGYQSYQQPSISDMLQGQDIQPCHHLNSRVAQCQLVGPRG